MKTTVKFIAAAFAIVAAASCTKEISSIEDNGREEATVETVQLSFPATLSAPESKTTLSGLKVHWTAGDAIYLHESGNTANSCKLVATGIEADYAIFSGEGIAADSYDAVYPHDAFKGGSIVEHTLSQQMAIPNNFSEAQWGVTNIAMAKDAANGERLQFNNLLSHFKFTVESEGISTIIISAEQVDHFDHPGNFYSGTNIGGTLVIKGNTVTGTLNDDTPITLTSPTGNFVKGKTYYAAFPPVNMKKLTFTLKDSSGNELHTMKGPDDFYPEANIIYNICSLSVPEVNTAQVGDYFYTEGTYSSNYDSSKTLAGIVFYVGDGMKADQTLMADYPSCTHGLVVATKHLTSGEYSTTWIKPLNVSWDVDGYMTTVVAQSSYGEVSNYNENSTLMTGYNNTKAIRNNASLTGKKCIDKLDTYYTNMIQVSANASPWYIPSMAEVQALGQAKSDVEAALASAGMQKLESSKGVYPTSSSIIDPTYRIEIYVVMCPLDGTDLGKQKVTNSMHYRLLPIFAF